jgi:Mg-chelatase subunit ChlI
MILGEQLGDVGVVPVRLALEIEDAEGREVNEHADIDGAALLDLLHRLGRRGRRGDAGEKRRRCRKADCPAEIGHVVPPVG